MKHQDPFKPSGRSSAAFRLRVLFVFAALVAFGLAPQGTLAQTTTYTTPGSSTYTVPAGVTLIRVDAWGAGGGGARVTSNGNRAGGGGGAFASSFIAVNPGDNFTVVVGGGGTGGSGTAASKTGGSSTFGGTLVVAAGGQGVADNSNTPGAGGTVAASTGQILFAGGSGGAGDAFIGGQGAAGGGGAGTTGAGGNASTTTAGLGAAVGGGNGGAGRTNQGIGNAGSTRGGGGAAGFRSIAFGSNRDGGAGAAGAVEVTVIPCPTAVVTPAENCANNTYTLNVNVTSIGSGGTLTYSVNNVPQVPVNVPSTGNYTLPPSGSFSTLDAIEWELTSNDVPPCAPASGSFASSCTFNLDCSQITTVNYCYGNNDTRVFAFQADPGETITLRFLSPSPIDDNDVIWIQEPIGSDVTLSSGVAGDLANEFGVNSAPYVSFDNDLAIRVESDGSGSCRDGAVSPGWTFEVLCTPVCTEPLALLPIIATNDCGNDEFSFEVNCFDPGTASQVDLQYTVDGGSPVTITNITTDGSNSVQLGPFPYASSVQVVLVNVDDPVCSATLPLVRRDANAPCPPANADCASAIPLALNGPGGCPANAVAGRTLDGGTALANPACGPNTIYDDVWYSFNSANVQDPITITVTPGTAANYGIELYDACGGVPILCSYNQPVTNFNGSGLFEDYLIRVFSTTAGAGSFSICLSATPVPSICGTQVYDSGGPSGNYGNNESSTITYCPDNNGDRVIATFTQFVVENNGWDKLYIFNGPTTSDPKFDSGNGNGSGPAPFGAGGWWGESIPLPGPFQSTHPTGCITFHFVSDGADVRAGWTANLTCCQGPPATAAPTVNSPVCEGGDIELEANSPTGTQFIWTGPAGFNSTAENPVRSGAQLDWSGTYTVTAQNGPNGCPGTPATVNVTVVNPPPPVEASASATNVCEGDQVDLFAALQTQALQDGFDPAPQAGWVATNTSTGGTPANADWTIRNGAYKGMNSNSGNYYVTDSDAQGSGGSTNTTLRTPAIDLTGYAAPVLTFRHYYRHLGSGFAVVEASTDLSGWTTLATYNTTQGALTNFATVNLSLSAFANQPTVYVRYRYFGEFAWYWGIDDVSVGQSATVSYAWTSSPAGFTSTDQNPTGVTVNTTTTYTVTASTAPNCTSNSQVTVETGVPLVANINEAGPFVVCAGLPFSASSTVSGGGLPYSYEWTLNAAVVGNDPDLINFVPAASGTLTLTVTDNCGDFSTVNRTVTVNPLPVLSVDPPGATLCDGGSVELTASGASSYSWAPATGLNTTTGPTVTATLSSAPPGARTYTVTGTDGNGCIGTTQATVFAPVSPTQVPSTSNFAICQASNVPVGQGLTAAACNALTPPTFVQSFGGPFSTNATTLADYATITLPPLPPGAVVSAARLRVINIQAFSDFCGTSQLSQTRFALSGAYVQGEQGIPGAPNAAGTLANATIPLNAAAYPVAGGSVTLRLRETTNAGCTILIFIDSPNPDATMQEVLIEVDYTLPTTTRWYDAASGGNLVSVGTVFDPVGASLVDNNVPGITTFYATCDYNGCESPSRAAADFEVVAPADAGISADLLICSNADPVNLFPLLGGTPDAGGTWTGPSAITGDLFVPGTMDEGVYTYTVISDAPCPPITATITVTYDLTDTDSDGVIDCFDNCPLFPGVQGQFCDANPDPNTFNLGVVTSTGPGECACIPVPCTENLTMVLQTDANPDEITWEITPSDDPLLVICEGGAPAANATVFGTCCLPEGCYNLRVFDSAGDGIASGNNGGYTLRYSVPLPPGQIYDDQRIIDNRRNFLDGGLSAIGSGPSAFCLPMGEIKPIYALRDKLDFTNNTGQFFVCEEDPAVSALWIPNAPNSAQSSNTGYQFWFYDPNGTYSFRRFRSHNISDGYASVGATRACHMKINNWAAANHIPEDLLLNVRVRPRIDGVNGDFGPAYLFKIDPVRAQCPLTKLLDFPGNQFLSCNATIPWGPGNHVYARPVTGANRYQFRFRIAAEGFMRVITSNNYFVQLNWATDPLEPGKTYTVDVRASKDGGATWCTDFLPPGIPPVFQPFVPGDQILPWGEFCDLTIAGGNAQGGGQNLVLSTGDGLTMWPNPNRSEQLWLNIDGIESATVAIDIFDLAGKRLIAREIATQSDHLYTVLDLNGDLAAGTYVVSIIAGEKRWTERLVIAR